jgi:hypothetical protein
VHQIRKGQTPYNTDTVALQAGARVGKVGASATLRSLCMDRQGALNTTRDLTRLLASQTQTLMTSRRLRRVMADTGSGYSPEVRPGSCSVWTILASTEHGLVWYGMVPLLTPVSVFCH